MDAVKQKVAYVIVTLLSFGGPNVGDRLVFVTAGEFRERADNVGVSGNKARGLDKNAKGHAKLR